MNIYNELSDRKLLDMQSKALTELAVMEHSTERDLAIHKLSKIEQVLSQRAVAYIPTMVFKLGATL